MKKRTMTNNHPAMTCEPRYLTGDKAGLKEFLEKFDVRLFYSWLLLQCYDAISRMQLANVMVLMWFLLMCV